MPQERPGDGGLWRLEALDGERRARSEFQERTAARRQFWVDANPYYYGKVAGLLRHIIEPGRSVLHLRCETGYFLDAVAPGRGIGVEISPAMVEVAAKAYPHLEFVCSDPQDYVGQGPFDYVLCSNITDTADVLALLGNAAAQCNPRSRLVLYSYNYLWQPLLEWASRRGRRAPVMEPNWLSVDDLHCFLNLAGFELVRTFRVVLFPKKIPLLSEFANRVLAWIPGLSRLCMATVLVARPVPRPQPVSDISVSVIVPCKNEEGNIAAAVARIPEMGRGTEIIFCDDKSTDNTVGAVEQAIRDNPHRAIRLVHGPGVCKAQNVWCGFRAATGEALMILDADLAVMPEELPYFLNALAAGAGDLINGSRMVYPIADNAMKFLNFMGNKCFSFLFSLLFGHYIKDTLCGTKVLWREDFKRIEGLLGTWGVEDLWGDYDLLFGAAKRSLVIHDLPVHYQERVFGVTKMRRVFWNGWRMLRMLLAAWRKLRLEYY